MVFSMSKRYSAVQRLIFDDKNTSITFKDVCSFIAYCVTKFEAVSCGLINLRFLFLPSTAPIKIPAK